MQLKRSEMIYRMHSKNWNDYQVVIENLKHDYASIMRIIAWHYYQVHQEFTGKNMKSDGWDMGEVIPIWDKENKFQLSAILQKLDGYRLNQIYQSEYDNDIGAGFGGGGNIPEHMREYRYIKETLIVPSKFINEFDMRKQK